MVQTLSKPTHTDTKEGHAAVMARLTSESIEKNLKYWETVKEVWGKPVIPESEVTQENLELFIFQSYLHYQSVQDVADIVNKLDFKRKSVAGHDVKYSSNDISDIIRNHTCPDSELQTVCRSLIDNNSKKIDRLFN